MLIATKDKQRYKIDQQEHLLIINIIIQAHLTLFVYARVISIILKWGSASTNDHLMLTVL